MSFIIFRSSFAAFFADDVLLGDLNSFQTVQKSQN